MPMLRAAVSLSRIATKARPVGERSRLSVPTMSALRSTSCSISPASRRSRGRAWAIAGSACRPRHAEDRSRAAVLAKYAVRAGGGSNHRRGLDDAILVKDNHLALGDADLREAVRRVRAGAPGLPLEVECRTLYELGRRSTRSRT